MNTDIENTPTLSLKVRKTFASKAGFFLLCSIIVSTALFYGTVHQPLIALFYVLVGLMSLFWMWDSFSSGYLRIEKTWIQGILFLAAAYGFLQSVSFGTTETGGVPGVSRTISYEPFATRMAALHFVFLGLFFCASMVFVEGRRKLGTLVSLITIFGFGFSFFAILQSVLSPNKIYGIYSSEFAVPFGSFVNRHNFAAYAEMCLSVPLGLLVADAIGKDKKLLYFTAIGVIGIALLLSGSRGGLVAAISGIAFLIFLLGRRQGKRSVLLKLGAAAVILGVVIAGAILVGGETSLNRFAETAASRDITTNRSQIWSVSLKMAGANLPFGVGLGAYGFAYSRYDSQNGMERVEQAHNDYLQVLTDGGLIGILLGAAFIVLLFRAGLEASKAHDKYLRGAAAGALAGCFAVFVHSLFDFVLHTTAVAVLFLSMCSLVFAALRLKRSEKVPIPTKPAGNVTSIAER